MKYESCEIRWNNGAWKIFDTEKYCDVAAYFTFEELITVLFNEE